MRAISMISKCLLVGICLHAFGAALFGQGYVRTEVDVSGDRFTLYSDPNTGNEVKLGGFSGLAPAFNHKNNAMFYVVTDRGPVADIVDSTKSPPTVVYKSSVVPEFNPCIFTVILRKNQPGLISRVLPLRKTNGDPITGLPNTNDEYASQTPPSPVDLSGNPLPLDPDGLDPEGITCGPGGSFWLCDENPSVCFVGPCGKVLLRFVPRGTDLSGRSIFTLDYLPKVIAKRRPNRGLEGIALSPGGVLYTVLQRPLNNPDKKAGDSSLFLRLLQINVRKLLRGDADAVKQLLYVTETNTDPTLKQNGVYASDLFALSDYELLVPERQTGKVYKIDVSAATDITPYEDADGKLLNPPSITKTTIELLKPSDLSILGITPVEKTEVLDLSPLVAEDPNNGKVEGLCVCGSELFLCPDNDFNVVDADYATVPATLNFFSPPNVPRIFSFPYLP